MWHLDVIGEAGSEEDEDKDSKQSWLNSFRSLEKLSESETVVGVWLMKAFNKILKTSKMLGNLRGSLIPYIKEVG